MTLPLWLSVALGALVAAVPTVLLVITATAPLWRRYIDANVEAKQVEALKGYAKGALMALLPIVRATPTPFDDALYTVVERAVRELETAKGRPATKKERERLKLIAESMLNDPALPLRVEGRKVVA